MTAMRPEERDLAEGVLFTDQYQLAMSQLYFDEDLHERPAQFDMHFRRYPDYGEHQAGYCVAAGLGPLLEWVESTTVTGRDLDVLRSQRSADGSPRFREQFLAWLEAHGSFDGLEIEAVPEGRVVHPHIPLMIVRGPLAVAQLAETALLNQINYPTLIATKASRVREAGRRGPVLEFGLRRGPERGANAGTRAAIVGGADFSSNVGMSHVLGLDPKGTHAHSMVQAFMALGGGELEAFRAFARTFPNDCVLVVDTIDTLASGVPNAIQVFHALRAAGHEPRGIRLDSGDLAYLAIQAARLLDDAGFDAVQIVLSSDLDELAIWQILSQIEVEAPRYDVDPDTLIARLVYGVGTRLITSHGATSLGGVYKLVAIMDAARRWVPAIKLSDSPEKVATPGSKRVWRVYDRRGIATADVMAAADEVVKPGEPLVLHHPHRGGVQRTLGEGEISEAEELLVPVFREGKRVGDPDDLATIHSRRDADLERLDPGVRRLVNPHIYHVSLSDQMKRQQIELAEAARDSAGH